MIWVLGIVAAVLLRFLFPRQFKVLLGALVLIVVAISFFASRGQKETAPELASIIITAEIDSDVCSDATDPIAVLFQNDSQETVEYISFSMRGYRPDFSGTVRESNDLSSDRIIASGEAWTGCWPLPPVALDAPSVAVNDLVWEASPSAVRWAE